MDSQINSAVSPAASVPHGTTQTELLTAAETITYLRLDTDQRNPAERLRNLIRRQGLPVIRRGTLRLFRRSAIDAWLDAGQRGRFRHVRH